jgi:uncharacterized protein HemX
MAEVSNELIYEILKKLQEDMASLDRKIDEVKERIAGFDESIRSQFNKTLRISTRHDSRLDRIERRLEIAEVG